MDKQIKNVEKYEEWQKKADDLDEWFVETKEKIELCDVPTSDVNEREKQKRFLNVIIMSFTYKTYLNISRTK